MASFPLCPRALVVDDETGFRSLLGWRLARLGLHVVTVCDGAEALQSLDAERFHIVVTDLTMPHLQGLNVLSEVKRRWPATEVIIVTGFGTVETAVYAMQQGAHDFLLKPFELSVFIGSVMRALAKACPTFQPLDAT